MSNHVGGIRRIDLRFKSRKLADVHPGGVGCHLIEQGFDTVTCDINFPRGTELRLVKRLGR